MGTKLSDDEKNGLSDEELEALDDEEEGAAAAADGEGDPGDDEDDGDDKPAAKADDADEDEEGDEPAGTDGAAKPADKPAADGDGDDAGAADTGKGGDAGADEVEQTLEVPPIALVEVPDVTNYEAERGVLLDERKQLRQQHRDGEISSDEYDDKLDALNDKLNALDRTKADADAAQRQNEAVQRSQYLWTIEQVKKDFVKTDSIDYDKNPVLMSMWDANVKALAKDEANATKSAEWFLRKAHQQVKEEIAKVAGTMGFTRGDAPAGDKKDAVKPDAKAKVKDAVKARQKDASKLKGVGELPAASNEDVGSDEFASLDGLTGLELEQALARMPEDRAAKYLKG
jgi:hypothetical protein